ncbi:hypothetical protein AF011_02240, partial [Listeria monocytogenes]|nr:hypothetical protein [Listeria monocytogenes]
WRKFFLNEERNEKVIYFTFIFLTYFKDYNLKILSITSFLYAILNGHTAVELVDDFIWNSNT